LRLSPHPLFAGIALTGAQQSRVNAIRTRAIEEARAIHAELRATSLATLRARQKGDTVTVARYAAETRTKSELLRALLARERRELRAVLGQADTLTFEQNKAKLDSQEAAIAASGRR
jgi:hypothetical protein